MANNNKDAFQEFYRGAAARLSKGLTAYNNTLTAETQVFLKPFMEAMADLNAGGKMLRGVLVNLGYRLAGHADTAPSDGAALAFEIFQTGVLIHDDIIDRAGQRRGKKTIPLRYEESLAGRGITPPAEKDTPARIAEGAAICAGDYLIAASSAEIARRYAGHPRLAEVLSYFQQVILDTVRGEMLDVVLPCEISDPALADDRRADILMTAVWDIYHLKTSRYSVLGPLHLGMLLGGMSPERMAAVDEAADDIGAAFQIKDDILGVFADQAKLGKDVGSDISEYKQTILYAYVRLFCPEAWQALSAIYGRAVITEETLAEVRRILETSGAAAYAENEMARCFDRASSAVETMDFLTENDRELLRGLIGYMKKREK